jgi:hypothetical protein
LVLLFTRCTELARLEFVRFVNEVDKTRLEAVRFAVRDALFGLSVLRTIRLGAARRVTVFARFFIAACFFVAVAIRAFATFAAASFASIVARCCARWRSIASISSFGLMTP